ncbi:hypothetical protein HQN89_23270 [Paenibacillus frigoriresistens]|uniref:stalk domain-containing protein n=1 Tax=Paenibacillus alginolyticus TaxID=59839 RepID=UPI001563F9EA|nr:stalk domain-containing protein [Paenibacillus frigoriresistens]NRF93863.1 hypothetical protein [Paenibacillus frigoriresistens]
MGFFSGDITLKLNRKVILIVVMMTIFAGVASASSINGDFEGNPIVKVKANGNELSVQDVPSVILNGRTMVPIYMLEQLGVNTIWDPTTYTVDVNNTSRTQTALNWLDNNSTTISIKTEPGGKTFIVYGTLYTNETDWMGQYPKIKEILYNLALLQGTYARLDVVNVNSKKSLALFDVNTRNIFNYYNGKLSEADFWGSMDIYDRLGRGSKSAGNKNLYSSSDKPTVVINAMNGESQKIQQPVITPAPKLPPTASATESSVIESRIDGDFEGYDQGKIYKLMNGQIWKQTSYNYHYHFFMQLLCRRQPQFLDP